MNPALQKYLMSLGPDALKLIQALGRGGKAIGGKVLDEGMGVAGQFPRAATGAAAGGLGALLGKLGMQGDEEEEMSPRGRADFY